jgi:hypothetical protein
MLCHRLLSAFANGKSYRLDNGSTLTYERTNERTNAVLTSDRNLRFPNAHESSLSTGVIHMGTVPR